ncbi:MAG: phosphoribosyl-AMP cyclohydrolase, partial [Sphingobium limneticum]
WVKAAPAGPTCHTGARSCFFRRVGPDGLTPVDAAADPVADAAN